MGRIGERGSRLVLWLTPWFSVPRMTIAQPWQIQRGTPNRRSGDDETTTTLRRSSTNPPSVSLDTLTSKGVSLFFCAKMWQSDMDSKPQATAGGAPTPYEGPENRNGRSTGKPKKPPRVDPCDESERIASLVFLALQKPGYFSRRSFHATFACTSSVKNRTP